MIRLRVTVLEKEMEIDPPMMDLSGKDDSTDSEYADVDDGGAMLVDDSEDERMLFPFPFLLWLFVLIPLALLLSFGNLSPLKNLLLFRLWRLRRVRMTRGSYHQSCVIGCTLSTSLPLRLWNQSQSMSKIVGMIRSLVPRRMIWQ